MITTHKAKKIIAAKLQELGLPAYRLTARTVGFWRGTMIFVTVHDWDPNPLWDELKDCARANGFGVKALGSFVQT